MCALASCGRKRVKRKAPRRGIACEALAGAHGVVLHFMRVKTRKKKSASPRNCVRGTRWRRTRDLNPRAGLSRPTPLAGEPLHHLGSSPKVNINHVHYYTTPFRFCQGLFTKKFSLPAQAAGGAARGACSAALATLQRFNIALLLDLTFP